MVHGVYLATPSGRLLEGRFSTSICPHGDFFARNCLGRMYFELAIAQTSLDKPHNLWKAYIDFESNNDHERARDLFEKHTLISNQTMTVRELKTFREASGANEAHEESMGCKEKIREVYERAIANVPPVEEKCYWKRYIYLWINYASYEEMSQFEIRQLNRNSGRHILGNTIRKAPRKKIFEKYIAIDSLTQSMWSFQLKTKIFFEKLLEPIKYRAD
ncbi:hypothetical protein CsSME_00033706 [Camellia sinensis var. sinensis]